MAELRRHCSTCGQSYGGAVIFCPVDGAALSARRGDSGADPFLGLVVGGMFRVDALIGAGAVARVYRAFQAGVERNVALKLMHPDLAADLGLRTRFQLEARIAGSLSHPHLLDVLLLSEFELEFEHKRLAIPFIVFEYLDGLSLRSALLARGPLGVSRTLHIVLQIADAVGEAHRHGIVHRDLKPENVMLVRRAEDPDFVKVLDFGVARVANEPTLATRAGSIFGSARYVAPECAAGSPSTPASDVYALATLTYECLEGRPPYDGDNAVQVLMKQQQAPAPRLQVAGVPVALARLLEQNLSKSPRERATDAGAFAQQLLEVARSVEGGPWPAWQTRRGHAFASTPDREEPVTEEPSPAPVSAARHGAAQPAQPARQILFLVLCFALGAGAAIGVAAKVFDRQPATSNLPQGNEP